MQRFNMSETVHHVTRIVMNRQDVVGRSMKQFKLWTGLASFGASCRAMSNGAISRGAEALAKAMRRLTGRTTARLAGPDASWATAPDIG